MEDYIGSLVRVEHANVIYQGKFAAFDPNNKAITLLSVIKEGIPTKKCLTLDVDGISFLKILDQNENSTVAKPAAVKNQVTQKQLAPGVQKLLEVNAPRQTINARTIHITNNYTEPVQSPKSVDIAPTPQFRTYGPQVPQPVKLAELPKTGRPSSRKSRQGPSGNPIMDVINSYKGTKGKRTGAELDGPIDFDLDKDFDFDANLALFQKDDIDEEYYEEVEKPKMSKNFAHYENIISEPQRVTSWTNIQAKRAELKGQDMGLEQGQGDSASFNTSFVAFESSSYEKTHDGRPMPAITAAQKATYMEEGIKSMGRAVFDSLLADRLYTFTRVVEKKFAVFDREINVVASSETSLALVRRYLGHLNNRRYKVHIYGKYPGHQYNNVTVADHVDLLPMNKLTVLLSPTFSPDIEMWLQKQVKSEVIAVENVPKAVDPANLHLLMIGVATAGLRHVKRQPTTGRISLAELAGVTQSSSQVVIDSTVVDIGLPFSIFDETSEDYLADVFSSRFLVVLAAC